MARSRKFLERPKSPKTLREAARLVNDLWDLVQELRSALELNSGNSSIPPSQDRLQGKGLRSPRRSSGKPRGAQAGHVRKTRPLVPVSKVDHIQRYFPDTRCTCGGEIVIETEARHRHQVFDLPEITCTVTEHQRFGGTCSRCERSRVARLPREVPAGQMGPGLMAWIALLGGQFRMSTRMIQNFLAMQWGLSFSTGAISESQEPVAEWLEPLCAHIGDTIRQAPVAYADETPHFREKERLWLWVLCTPQLAFYHVHPSRGMTAARALLGSFAGVLITDRHGAYGTHEAHQRQLCWAHIIRNLERMAGYRGDAGELGRWLVHGARLIIRIEHRWRKSGYRSEHCRRRLEMARSHFEKALQQGHARHDGQTTGRVCQELLKVEPMLWRFLASPGLDLTNNAAERALRPYVIWRKTSFFSQSGRGDQFRSRVMTVAESCRRLGLCAYALLRQVCEQGIRKEPVSIRLPIDHLYPAPISHQLVGNST